MKRVLGVILSIILVTQSIGVFGAVKTQDLLPTYDREAEILINLGIIKNYDMTNYDPYSYIPNREFLSMLSGLMGGEEPDDYELFARQLGTLENDERLQDFLYPTADFAMAAALGTLGYNKLEVMSKQGRRAWALQQASRLGLLNGIPTQEGMSLRRAEAVNLVYNMLDSQILDLRSVFIDKDGFVTASYDKSEAEALYMFRKIYYDKDIIDGTAFVEMYGESSVGDGRISIGGKLYSLKDGADFDRYVGLLCDVYIEDETQTVISVTPARDIKSVVVEAENIDNYSETSRTITYTSAESSKIQQAVLEKTAAVISNGRGLEKYGKADIKVTNGTISLYDNDGNGKYDLAVIDTAKIFLTDSVNISKRVIYNKLTNDANALEITVDERDTDAKISIVKNGIPATLSELAENDVLEVYYNAKAVRKTIKIVASSLPVTGTVTFVSSDLKKISVGGKDYGVSENYRAGIKANDKYTPQLKAGQAYVLYINSNGFAEAAEPDKYDGMTCGYLFAADEIESAFDSTYAIRIYTDKGKWETYKLTKKVKLNNTTSNVKAIFLSDIKSREGELILVRTNSNGEVNEVKTAIDGFELGKKSENFNKNQVDESAGDVQLIWRNVANYFEGNHSRKLMCYIGSATKMFTADGSSNLSEDDIGMTTVGSLKNDNGYTGVVAYGIDEFGIADYVVLQTDDNMRKQKVTGGTVMLVSETYETLNEDGDIVKVIVGPYDFLARYTITFDADAKQYAMDGTELTQTTRIEQGDLVRFNRNANGLIDSYSILCKAADADKGQGYFPSLEEQPRGLHTTNAFMYGTLVASDAAKGVFMLDVKANPQDAQLLKSAVTATTVKVFICEGNERIRTVSNGSLRDMAKGDFVYAAATYGSVHTIVIYK